MKTRVMSACWLSVLGLSVLLLFGPSLFAQGGSSPSPTVRHAVAGVTLPLRELAKLPARPRYVLQANHFLRPSQRRSTGVVVDGVEQSAAGGGSSFSIGANSPGLGLDFSGFDTNFNYPDDNIAVGQDQIVQVANNSVAVFDKSLNSLGSVSIDTILGQLGGDCAAGTPEGHPIAQYDRTAGQWLIAENVVSAPPYNGTACIAVSQTSDATGNYYLYEFSLGSGYPDLPKWGVMPTGFFQSNDNFGADGVTYQGAYECAYDRATMEMGGDAAQVCFLLTPGDFALLPADQDSVAPPPPAGQDEFLFSLWDSSDLALYSFHTDWSNPNNAFMTGSGGSQLFPVPMFTPACNGQYLGACVPQLGSPDLLDVLGDRLLYRVAYYDDVPPKVPATALPAHLQHWLIVHDVTASGGNTAERWYEFYASTKITPVTAIRLLQSGTYAPDDTTYRWTGSIARDSAGDILMGYSASSRTIYPSIAITGRTLSDPNGTMEGELPVISGGGPYNDLFDRNLNRWGDYTSMRLDPADNCTFWYTNEYYSATGLLGRNWSTQINSAQFSDCAPPK
jgi:hypothetical protein